MRNIKDDIPQEDGSYKCKVCGSDILGKEVNHPIWDGPFPCSGSGKCSRSIEPYCPKCDQEPRSSGSPIYR